MTIKTLTTLTAVGLVAFACQKKSDDSVSTPQTLYVSTGACNAGFGAAAKTTYVVGTASRTIERFSTLTGGNQGVLVDYTLSNFHPNMDPKKIIDNGDSLYVEMENATTASDRAIWKVPKNDPINYISYFTNAAAFSAVLRGLALDTDGAFIVGVTTKLEKVNSAKARLPAGANPWVNAPAAPCATSTTGMSDVGLLAPLSPSTSGKILYAHQSTVAGATTQRLGSIASNGYFVAGDCTGGVQISAVAHSRATSSVGSGAVAFNANGTSPTAMVYIPTPTGTTTGKLIVAYSNDQTSNNAAGVYNANHAIAMWDVVETAGAVTFNNPFILYDNVSVIYGISALAYDAGTGMLYVATGGEPSVANMATNNVGYNIEKFSLDMTTPLLTRVAQSGNQPFIKGGSNTRCISSMAIGN